MYMTFEMSERVKYRLVGGVVVLSIAAIATSTIMKIDNHPISASLNTPTISTQPAIVQKTVAQNNVVPAQETTYVSFIAKAEPLSGPDLPTLAKLETPVTVIKKIAPPIKTIAAAPSVPIANNKTGYGVQLASLSSESNAENLVAALRKHGFVARYGKFKGKQGEFYQVIAGLVPQKNDAINLQKKIAASMKINGFVIQTGMG